MRFAEIIIKPVSAFGTPLKGDTIFGHFCWQLAYDEDLLKGSFFSWMERYSEAPFVVFSSAYPRIESRSEFYWLIKKPALPLHFFGEEGTGCFEKLSSMKEKKSKNWLLIKNLEINLKDFKLLNDREAYKFLLDNSFEIREMELYKYSLSILVNQLHNRINRLSFSTGEGFAPYITENIWFLPGLKLSIFALYQESALDEGSLKIAFERIGKTGYGKDATWGMGRFEVEKIQELPVPKKAEYLYMLSPFVPKKSEFKHIWFQPVVRFGKHGSFLANSNNPFKEPVLMAEEGAVIESESLIGPIVGKAVLNVSKVLPQTVVQGYSIAIPFSFGGNYAKSPL